jgi:hypothetical protein
MGRWSKTAKVLWGGTATGADAGTGGTAGSGGGTVGGGGGGTGAPASTTYEQNEQNEQNPGDGACPRCAELDAAARQVLEGLSTHPALPPALRCLPPEKLGILVRWTVVSLTNPRPAWPPPRPTDARRKHRRPLDGVIEDLGGHASGAEPPPTLEEEEWNNAGD